MFEYKIRKVLTAKFFHVSGKDPIDALMRFLVRFLEEKDCIGDEFWVMTETQRAVKIRVSLQVVEFGE